MGAKPYTPEEIAKIASDLTPKLDDEDASLNDWIASDARWLATLAALTASHAACVRAARRMCCVHAGATVDQIRAATIVMARTAPDPTAAADAIALLDALSDPLAREVSDGS